jgi:hypothetical protein
MQRARPSTRTSAAVALAWLALSGGARAADVPAGAPEPDLAHVEAAMGLMQDLRAESDQHAAAIREAYGSEVAALALPDRRALTAGLQGGSLLMLPPGLDADVRPRLAGRHPIGEADLEHQHLYVAARPETLGLLLEVASRVGSGPLDVTSMVRHGEYQRRLTRSNPNARTSVPTHVMGLAFDISILYTSLARAVEIRDALRGLAAEGDLYFVAERSQLVFHVVPAPARRPYYAARHQQRVVPPTEAHEDPSPTVPPAALLPVATDVPAPIRSSPVPIVLAIGAVLLVLLLPAAPPIRGVSS